MQTAAEHTRVVLIEESILQHVAVFEVELGRLQEDVELLQILTRGKLLRVTVLILALGTLLDIILGRRLLVDTLVLVEILRRVRLDLHLDVERVDTTLSGRIQVTSQRDHAVHGWLPALSLFLRRLDLRLGTLTALILRAHQVNAELKACTRGLLNHLHGTMIVEARGV